MNGMKTMRKILMALVCMVPFCAMAQEGGGRTCRVLFLGAGQNDAEKLQLHDGIGAREVALPRLNLSEEYALPAGALTLRLLEKLPVEGEPLPASAPTAAVPELAGDIYLLVMPDPNGGKVPAVRMQVIDASAAKFRDGQMMWYNLTAHDVGGVVGSEKLVIKAASREILAAPAKENIDYNVNLSYRMKDKEALYPLCETRWVHDPTARMLVFIINEPGVRTPRVMAFPDHREKKDKSN